MKRLRTHVTLITDNRIIPINSYSERQIQQWQRHGQRSALWQEITYIMDTQYPNDTLSEIQARGGVNTEWQCHYQAPPLKRPVMIGFGAFAGHMTTEVWA